MTVRFTALSGALVTLLLASGAHAASVIYEYQGNQFDDIGLNFNLPCVPTTGGCLIDHVTVSLEFSSALSAGLSIGNVTPDAWSITDGLTTITDSTPGIATATNPTPPPVLFWMQLGTDSFGEIDEWNIDINPTNANAASAGEWTRTRTQNFSGLVNDDTRYCQAGSGSCSSQDLALVKDNAGSWTMTVVPIPAAVWLFGSALGLLGWLKRRC